TGIRVAYALHESAEDGIIPRCVRFTAWEPLEDSSDKGFLKFSVPASIARPETFALENSEKAITLLKERLPAFRKARVAYASRHVFARETQRLEAEYVLTEHDVVSGRKFGDGLVKNAWPVEFWHPEKGPVYKYLAPGDYYEIPLRCLRPAGVGNLLATGTGLCADPQAHASARVMGPCMALGDKAGVEAARFAEHGHW
ncbi:MAG: FAD-dependent oxidoreductase, partial [Thermodesulfobacteriota bacterium]